MGQRQIIHRVLAGAATLLLTAPAVAQFGPDEHQQDLWSKPQGQVDHVQVKGKIRGIQADVVQVANEEQQQQWLVKLPRELVGIRVTGKARPSYLQPGMMVRFAGQFDTKGKPQAPISRLEVFTLKLLDGEATPAPLQFGVFPEAAFSGETVAEGATVVKPLIGQPGAAPPPSDVASFVVSGQLRGFRKGELLVAAGTTLVRAPLAENAEISVDVPDYRWVRPGDEIEVHGWSYPHLKTHVVATRVAIRAGQPFGIVPEEKPAPAIVPTPPARKPAASKAKTEDEEFPF